MHEEGAGIVVRTSLPFIRPSLTFLRHLFSFLHLTKAPHHFVCLGAGARADLAWWKCFLHSWSGSSFFPLPNPSHSVYSDASGTYGCGAVVDSLVNFQLEWSWRWHTKQIVNTCTTFKSFITYLTLLGISPLAELCSSGSLSRYLWNKATHSFTDLPIFT